MSSVYLEQVVQQLKQLDVIEDLDLSKCQCNTQSCLQTLANLIVSNKNLKSLSL